MTFWAAVMLAAATMGCVNHGGSYRECDGSVWHTTYHIVYGAQADKPTPNLDDSIMKVLELVDKSLSVFNKASVVSGVNRGDDIVVDSLFAKVFLASVEVNRNSGGAFDPTLSPLINLWGFGYKGDKSRSEPTSEEIARALATVGISQCALSDGKVVKKHPSTEFNFSAIAKGFACDEVGRMLVRNGISNYMVEIGGEIAVSGRNPHGEEWRIAVDAPIESDTAVVHSAMTTICLGRGGVATSGNYRNFRKTDSGRFGHTISALTGCPIRVATLSATVVAEDAMLADAYATACMAMPPDSAAAMMRRQPSMSALLVVDDGAGGYVCDTIGSFPL